MFVVAIVPPRAPSPGLADALATVTGRSQYELRTRLKVLGQWPGVLDTYAEQERAEALRAAADELGCTAWVMPAQPDPNRTLVRRFSLRADVLTVVGEGDRAVDIDVPDVQMLLAGNRYGVTTDNIVERAPRPSAFFSPALAIPAAANAKAVMRRSEHREAFLHLYARGQPTQVFTESGLQYAAVELGALQPTRRANFDRVVDYLRRTCAHSTWDDRLLQRRFQARLLGPTLRPERYLDQAIALLTRRVASGGTGTGTGTEPLPERPTSGRVDGRAFTERMRTVCTRRHGGRPKPLQNLQNLVRRGRRTVSTMHPV